MSAVTKGVPAVLEEPAHSELGPSSSDRWMNCPSSVIWTRDLPDEETEYSRAGSCAHQVAKEARETGRPAKEWIGKVYFGITVDREMAACVQEFIDYVAGIPGDDYNERKVYYTEYAMGGFGTMDAAKAQERRAHIIDLKFGEGVQVFAEKNTQLMLYALGFYLTYGWMYELEDFVLTVFQPRLSHVDSWVITLSDLLKWAETDLRAAVKATLDPGAPSKAGEWCRFCKFRRVCEIRGRSITQEMVGELDDLDAKTGMFPRPARLTQDQVVRILRVRSQALQWLKDVESHALSLLAHGEDLGGYKLVEGRSDRRWAHDDEVVAEALREHFKIAAKDMRQLFKDPKLLSPREMEQLFGAKHFRQAKDDKPAGPLAYLIDKPKGKPTLVPPEDKRPEIGVTVSDEFDDLDAAVEEWL